MDALIMRRRDRKIYLKRLPRKHRGHTETLPKSARPPLLALTANHTIKVGLALRLRRETTMDLEWIAQELGVGSWKYLSNLLNRETPAANQGKLRL